MHEDQPGGVEQVLHECEAVAVFLTPRDRQGGWRAAFGEAEARVPEPYWLFAEDENTPLALGFPLLVTTAWESFCRDLSRLVEAETLYRCALALQEPTGKATLVELRTAIARRLADLLENAHLNDHGRRLPEILWLAVSREVAESGQAAARGIPPRHPSISPPAVEEIRYTVAQRLTDVAQRAETEALSRLRRFGAIESSAPPPPFSAALRQDLLPVAETRISRQLEELDAYLQGHLKVDPARFHRVVEQTTAKFDALRQRDGSFNHALSLLDPEAASFPSERALFSTACLDLLAAWKHPETPRLSPDMITLLKDLSGRLKRFEVIACLRSRLYPVSSKGSRPVTRLRGQFVTLSASMRPLDFTNPGVVDSTVRRYGLLYDLVEFTQLVEELRRRGHSAEENGLRFMVRFQRQIEEIRARHRLKFEKFLGDGGFYSARSARAVLLAAAELRILYERLRHQGFPFDRGLRLALNVGTYHLLPMTVAGDDRPHFEFFGHGLVELARLTTGKTTHEVEDIADFLLASGYDVHRVLEFLEPVRHGSRYPEHVRERSYAAFLAENGELVNLGGVVTEAFLRDLEVEWAGPLGEVEHHGLHWVLLPCRAERLDGPWIGLRFLGTARLKGLQPTPLAEMVVFDQPPDGLRTLPEATTLVKGLLELAADGGRAAVPPPTREAADHARLCVVSALEDAGSRTWYIGHYFEESDALANAFHVPLNPVDLQDGEPFEAWLFRRREELGKLYHGLRRDSSGATVPLDSLRGRDGYFTCLLASPHRSPR